MCAEPSESLLLSACPFMEAIRQEQQTTRLMQSVIDFADPRLQRELTERGACYLRAEANKRLANRFAAEPDQRNAKRYYKPN